MPQGWWRRQLDRNPIPERALGGPWYTSLGGVALMDQHIDFIAGWTPNFPTTPEVAVATRTYSLTTQNWVCMGRLISPPLAAGQTIQNVNFWVRAQVSNGNLTAHGGAFAFLMDPNGVGRGALTQAPDSAAGLTGPWGTSSSSAGWSGNWNGGGVAATVDGERVVIDLYARFQASMASAFTATVFLEGTTVGFVSSGGFALTAAREFLPEPEPREVIVLHARQSANFVGAVSTAPQSVRKVDGGSNARPSYNRDMRSGALEGGTGQFWPRQINQVGEVHLYGGKFISPPMTTDVIPGQMVSLFYHLFTTGNGVLLWIRPTLYVVTPEGAVRRMIYDTVQSLAPGTSNTLSTPVNFGIPGVSVEPGDRLVMEQWAGVTASMSGTFEVQMTIWNPTLSGSTNPQLAIEDLWYEPEIPPVPKIFHQGQWIEGEAKGWTGNAWAPVKIRHEGEWKEVVKP